MRLILKIPSWRAGGGGEEKRRHRTEAQGLQECLEQMQEEKVELRCPLERMWYSRERTYSIPWMSPGAAWRVCGKGGFEMRAPTPEF